VGEGVKSCPRAGIVNRNRSTLVLLVLLAVIVAMPAVLLLLIALANPTLLDKVHGLPACAIAAAMLGPVLLVPRRDIQVHGFQRLRSGAAA
jgi:hypothetical protein